MGGDNPIRIQSMTTTNTNDTASSIAQAERIIEAGGELVRLTTQGSREAENLKKAQREAERAEQRQQLLAIQEELKRVREAKAAAEAAKASEDENAQNEVE